jgi:hypothetical protein
MDKQRHLQSDEVNPSLDGPDYVALVIEWDEIAENLGEPSASRSATAPSFSDRDPTWNRVDEASMESFPASDPPAWGSSHAVAQANVPEDIPEEVTAPFSASRPKGVQRVMLGLAAAAALFSMIEGLRRLRRYAA